MVAIGGLIELKGMGLESKEVWPLDKWSEHRAGWVGGDGAGFQVKINSASGQWEREKNILQIALDWRPP
eukprot:gene10925-5583_t